MQSTTSFAANVTAPPRDEVGHELSDAVADG